MATFIEDLRFAVRSLRRAPLLTAICILTLALGIALNATVFTIVTGLIFRPRVANEPERYLHLSPSYRETAPSTGKAWSISADDYRAFASRSRTLGELAGWDNVRVTIGTADTDVLGLLVTCNFFRVYGLERPAIGRLFTAEECSRAAPVLVLSEEIWRERFNADPQIIGTTLRLNRTPFTVVGIAPAGFSGRLRGPGLWMPWTMQPFFYKGRDYFREPVRWLTAEGRLKPGVSREASRAELQVIAAQQDRLHPGRQTTMVVTNGSLAEEPSLRGQIFWISPVIMGGLTLVLLVACTNVTVLQLSRAVSRTREMAIRLSLGAGTGRLIRMLLTESLVLASAAGVASAVVVYQAPQIFEKALASYGTPVYQTRPDASTLVYLSIVVLLAACITGLSPAAESLRIDLAGAIKRGTTDAGPARGTWYRNALVVTQVSLTFVLLVAAGLFIRARDAVLNGNPGFETSHVFLLPLDLSPADRATLAARVRDIPGVQAVAFGSPLSQSEMGTDLKEIRQPGQQPGTGRLITLSAVSAGYFEALSVPVIRGRAFTAADEQHAPAVCMVSERLARSFWPGVDPLGQWVLLTDHTALQVIGVVPETGPQLYQLGAPGEPMLIRFAGDERRIGQAIGKAVAALDPAAVVVPKTLRMLLNEAADRLNRIIRLLSGLAVLTMLLAAAGLYGVVDFTMRRRTKEIGIRVAIGASRGAIVMSALLTGTGPVLWGLGLGAMAAIAAAMVLERVLRQTPVALEPADPVVYIAVAALLGITALAAMLRPVWRAAASDPIKALRDE